MVPVNPETKMFDGYGVAEPSAGIEILVAFEKAVWISNGVILFTTPVAARAGAAAFPRTISPRKDKTEIHKDNTQMVRRHRRTAFVGIGLLNC
jgi:hypothetical protein